jgi:streptothricin acetyltransferase
MNISIREMTLEDNNIRIHIDDSFTVDSILVLSLTGRQLDFTVKEIPSYQKSYSDELSEAALNDDYAEYIDNSDQIIYLAFAGNQIVGRIILKRNWNKYAYIEEIAVDKAFRGYGIGRQLIEHAKQWAMNGGMPGIMLETQNNNVNACLFYASCGFVIGGFDSCLYQGIHKDNDEIALFLYLVLE